MFLLHNLPSSTALRYLTLRSNLQQKRNISGIPVTVLGVASEVGFNLSMLLKQSPRVSTLKVHDFDPRALKLAEELSIMNGEATVSGYAEDAGLKGAIIMSKLILQVYSAAPSPAISDHELARHNAPYIQKFCKAVAECNPNAFIGIATNPVNIMVPYAFEILKEYSCFDLNKLFGVTGLNELKAKSFAAEFLGIKPWLLSVPVIGGHSSETIVPLYSNMKPEFYSLDKDVIYKLTSKVRKMDLCTGGRAFSVEGSIYDFANRVMDALWGEETDVHCFTENASFGTRFFSAPVTIGPSGLVQSPNNFLMSRRETDLLNEAIDFINEDVLFAEKLPKTIS